VRRTLLVLSVAALVGLAGWAVYGYAQGRQACDVKTCHTAGQAAMCQARNCQPAGFCHDGTVPACDRAEECACRGSGGCKACPEFVDEDADGVCDAVGTCDKHAQCRCGGGGICHNR